MLPALSAEPAQAAAAQALPVQVVIDRLTPQVPGPGATLRLSGRVVNTGPSPVTAPSVDLRLSATPLTSRDAIVASAAPEGSHGGTRVPGTEQRLPGTVEPGGSLPWSIRVPVARLGLGTGQRGVYVLGVEARSEGSRVGITKTFLPWFPPAAQLVPTRVVLLWPIVDRPREDAHGLFTDDGLARDLAPAGRLGRLVAAGKGKPVTWVVDPDLLQTVADMVDGYEVGRPDRHQPGRGAAVAAQWLRTLRTATAGREVLALPYADPDVTALQHNGLGGDIGLAVAAEGGTASRLLGRAVRTDVAWPPGGQADLATLTALRRAGATAAVLDGSAVPLSRQLTFTPTGRVTLPTQGRQLAGLLADNPTSTLLSSDLGRPGAGVLVGQQLLAETAMITEEHPGDQRTVLLAPPRRWNPDPRLLEVAAGALGRARWLAPATFAQMQATPPPQVERGSLAYPRTARQEELGRTYLLRVATLRRQLRRYTSILADPKDVRRAYQPAVLRSESSAWRHAGQQGYRYERNAARDLTELERQVRIISRNTVTLSSKTGKIPITVINESKQQVTVRLRMTSTVTRRLELGRLPARRTIGPAHQVTFEVPAKAVSNGIVLVTAQLETPSGVPYGEELRIPVRATNYGQVALYLVGGATALLFVAVAVRLFRRARAAIVGDEQAAADKVGV